MELHRSEREIRCKGEEENEQKASHAFKEEEGRLKGRERKLTRTRRQQRVAGEIMARTRKKTENMARRGKQGVRRTPSASPRKER